MKLLKKLLILFYKNKKIVLPILLILTFSPLTYFLDLPFFNNQEIPDLKKELIEFKEEINFEEKKNLNIDEKQDSKKTPNNLSKYFMLTSFIVLIAVIIYTSGGDGGDPSVFYQKIKQIGEINPLNAIVDETTKKK